VQPAPVAGDVTGDNGRRHENKAGPRSEIALRVVRKYLQSAADSSHSTDIENAFDQTAIEALVSIRSLLGWLTRHSLIRLNH